ncbi:hypothetical protein PF001_g25370 [Phytophthora fragariae]|uniref:Uncharacterized protein n=1 Tax=Phytophthora fragariae TaxID=53985 RepID=A0A6A4BT72_9STRA|nr:hypothetical protein PF001_g25370 [Phytophthora fragariae]
MTWPSFRITTSSKSSKTSGDGCSSEMTTVLRNFLAMLRCVVIMSKVAALSRPVLISSIIMTNLLPNSISPVVTRLRSPPDTPRVMASPTMVFWQLSRPSCWMTMSG